MTREEACRRYEIPVEILKEYERCGFCRDRDQAPGACRYEDSDLERISLMMTLCEAGLDPQERETYMRMFLAGQDTLEARLRILDERREDTLREIHGRERQLDLLDDLRHRLRMVIQKERRDER